MFRKFLAIFIGLFAGMTAIWVVMVIGHAVYPPPQELDHNNREAIEAYMTTAPLGAFLFILLGWAVGSYVAGLVSTLIAKDNKSIHALICGCILLFLGIYNLVSFTHPVWFWPSLAFIFIPFAWLGFRTLSKKKV